VGEQRRKLGIIGGMGPEATVYFMHRVIELTPATRDQDHIDMLVSNHVSIPDRSAFIRGQASESPLEDLLADARMLAEQGCEVLAIPCNTSHVFYDTIAQAVDAQVLNIVDESLAACKARGAQKVGVLATWGTLITDIYGSRAKELGVACQYPRPTIQEAVNEAIYDYVKAGKPVPDEMLVGFYDGMAAMGCDAVVLGCTELSVAHAALSGEVRAAYPFVVDSLEALAAACVRECA